jgi:hypothetical protein
MVQECRGGIDVLYERQARDVADMVEQQTLGVLFRRARAEVNAYFTSLTRDSSRSTTW